MAIAKVKKKTVAVKKNANTPSSNGKTVAKVKKPSATASSSALGDAKGYGHSQSRIASTMDRLELADLIYRFARGLDRSDDSLLRAAFHVDATVDLGPGIFQGMASDYIIWALGSLQQSRSSQHMVGNMWMQIDGDVALVESYCHAYLRLEKPTGKEDLFIASRWLDRMERRPSGHSGIWRIAHRKVMLDLTRAEPAADMFYHHNPDALWSGRGKADPSYQMAQFPGSQSGNKLPSFVGRKYDSKSIKL